VSALLDAGLRGMLLAVLLLLAALLWRQFGARSDALLGRLLCLGLAVQVLVSAPAIEAALPLRWQGPGIAISVANAVLFWLFCRSLFDDEFRLRPRHLLPWLGVVGLTLLNCSLPTPPAQRDPAAQAALLLQRLLPLGFGALALWQILRQHGGDLLEPRRRLRLWVVGGGLLYALTQLLMRLGQAHGSLDTGPALLDMALLLLILAPLALHWLQLGPRALTAPAEAPADPAPAPPAADEETPEDADRVQALLALMQTQRLYRDERLSPAWLARRLGLPEYRLRRLINQHLGHRNFTAFINGFRLADARAALADPARRDESVLAIALDAGFQSIGPFNRAFKAETGLTPSEFRRQQLAG
jgi:AraC-like DNA-binding protein